MKYREAVSTFMAMVGKLSGHIESVKEIGLTPAAFNMFASELDGGIHKGLTKFE